MKRGIAGSILIGLLLSSAPAPAAPNPAEFQQHYERAVTLFLSERYQEALKEFQAAYAARQLPRLLINIGTAYRKLGQAKEALQAYEEYLKVEPNPAPEVKKKLQECLVEARAMLDAASKAVGGDGKQKARPKVAKGLFQVVTATPGHGLSAKIALKGIAGNAADDLFVVGAPADTARMIGPTIHHFDGKEFTPSYGGWGGDLQRIAGAAANNLWAVGTQGTVLHFDGEAWHRAESGTEKNLVGVWTGGPSEAWAMDESGAVLRLEGTDWLEVPGENPETATIFAVHASAPKNALGVGAGGTILRWDGTQVVAMPSGTKENLFSVWVGAQNNAWAVGKNGAIVHYDGSAWVNVPSGTTKALFGVYGVSPSEIYAVGGDFDKPGDGIVLRWNGKNWLTVLPTTKQGLRGVFGEGGDVYAAGEQGLILKLTKTKGWTEQPRKSDKDLWAVYGKTKADLWAVGQGGTILHSDGTSWSTAYNRTSDAINGVFRNGQKDYWAVGDGGTIVRWNGQAWTAAPSGTTESLNSVWASGPKDAFAVGRGGTIRHYDGTAWSNSPSGVKDDLASVWGSGPRDVYAVGDNATVLHYDGRSWTRQPSGYQKETNLPQFSSVWGSGDKDVWLVGAYGFIGHNDGSGWTMVTTKNSSVLSSVYGAGPRDIWAVGYGPVLHYDGKAWTISPSGSPESLYGVTRLTASGGKTQEIWAVGERGTVMRVPVKKKP